MAWKDLPPDKQGNETQKVHHRIAPFVSGHGVDLGCGCWPLKVEKTMENSCLAIDGGYSPQACAVADMISDVSALPQFSNESFDYVYSSHTLEDMSYPEAVLTEWWRILKPGGNLILYLPLARQVAKSLGIEKWEEFYPDKGTPGANFAHEHDYSPIEIREMVARIGNAELLVDEIRGEYDEYSFLQVYRKLSSAASPVKGLLTAPKKRALVVRYGAIGDVIQSTPVFKKLKEDGYHVTLNCSPVAKEILANNPNVDEFAVQIKDYVPNIGNNLEEYWKEIGLGYDKFVNLSGAAENSLLIPDKKIFDWQALLRKEFPQLDEAQIFSLALDRARKLVGDTNYYDNHLSFAGYSDTGLNGELYFSPAETIMAEGFRSKYKDRFIVIWAIAGSSYHKVYPYIEQVIQELCVRNPDVLVITTGDAQAKLLEREASKKYFPRAGEWTLRTSMLMTKYADLVIGPETGMLNAAGCFDTPKITLLSHSSHDNFCKYFKNDYCLAPETPCFPCHVLHYHHTPGPKPCISCGGEVVHKEYKSGESPMMDKTGMFWSCPYTEVETTNGTSYGSVCAASITPKRVLARINEVYTKWKSAKSDLVQIEGAK
jgi:ADP-heptose:LPS heptosyltransferase/predicted SAM-dependent methyltransferase